LVIPLIIYLIGIKFDYYWKTSRYWGESVWISEKGIVASWWFWNIGQLLRIKVRNEQKIKSRPGGRWWVGWIIGLIIRIW
jgi:hypothetical protein